MKVVDVLSGDDPARTIKITSNTITLQPYSTAVIVI